MSYSRSTYSIYLLRNQKRTIKVFLQRMKKSLNLTYANNQSWTNIYYNSNHYVLARKRDPYKL